MKYTGERMIIGEMECGKESDVYKEHIGRYNFAVQLVKDKRVLDIACGSGYGAAMLVESGAKEVVGGDIDDEVIRAAKDRYKNSNLNFEKVNAEELFFNDEYFDVVVSFETIEHIKDYKKYLSEIKRVLRPGGLLIISTPNRKITHRLGINNPYHIKEFILNELREELEGYFTEIELYGQRAMVDMNGRVRYIKIFYNVLLKIGIIQALRRLVPERIREKVGNKIDGVGTMVQVEKMKDGTDFMYLVAVGINKS